MTAAAVFLGFIADCIFGDPVYKFHPVRLMGAFISKSEKFLRAILAVRIARVCKNSRRYILEFISGMLLSLALVGLSFAFACILLSVLYKNIIAGLIAESLLCYQMLAAKSLKDESMKVYYALADGDMEKARKNLSYIVGRDTENLNEEAVVKATVETVAENLSDGVIAPIFYMLIGGAPLGFACKAVNTLDSMIGYRNEKYEYFGKFAARLDDAMNFVPARISALLMILAAFICGLDAKQALKVFRRDRYKHKSPNSAQTESVCAGALGLSLSGDNYYGGRLVSKPIIGEARRRAVNEDIKLANRLMYVTSWLGIIIGGGLRVVFYVL